MVIPYEAWSAMIIGHGGNTMPGKAMQSNTTPISGRPTTGSGMDHLTFLAFHPYPSAQHSNILFWNFAWICKPAFAASMAGVLCSVSDDAGEIDQYQGVPGRLILCVTALVLRRERHQCSCVVSEPQTFGDRQSANTQRDFAAAAPLFDSTKKHKGQENEGGHDRPLAPGCC